MGLLLCLIAGAVGGLKFRHRRDKLSLLTWVTYSLFLPAIILSQPTARAQDFDGVAPIAAVFVSATLAALILPVLAIRAGTPQRASIFYAAILGNGVFLGIPVANSLGLFGSTYILLIALESLIIVPLGSWLIHRAGRHDTKRFAGRVLLDPIVVSSVTWSVLFFLDLSLPEWIRNGLAFAGAAASPCALFVLGFAMTRMNLLKRRPQAVHLSALFNKLAVMPLAFLSLGLLFGLSRETALTGALFFSFPSAILTFIQAENLHGENADSAYVVVAGSLIWAALALAAVCAYALFGSPPLI